MQKIIILDHSTSEVHIFDYDPNVFESYEDFYPDLDRGDLFIFDNRKFIH